MTKREAFQKALPKYIRKAGMKQRDLANAVGVSEATVHCWMSGKAFPRIDTIEEIAKILNCTVDDLLDYVDPAQSSNQTMKLLDSFAGAPQTIHSSILDMLNSRINQTPQEDAKMATLWRNASVTAKRAAIAVLESMEGEKMK